MASNMNTCYIQIILFIFIVIVIENSHQISKDEKRKLRDEARDMFYHGYNSYMENAYPADELMPLSCKGRNRGTKPSRGDMDDILGNFSLTLVDSFDTLVIFGDVEEFESAALKVISDVTFDRDIVVSVFETNIRMLGGLLSGHVLAEYVKKSGRGMLWYRAELLDMAKELGFRLLPAFNTSTGIPFPKINLRHGVNKHIARTGHEKDTCTACAGTMLLEFAALSRLSGEPIFEAKAHRAMDSLWQYRHRTSNLVGTVINIHNGEWVRRDSGIGAGVDSYYEYLLKAYILLGDDIYLNRFNQHYDSIMKYISQGPLMVDVHMHKPHANSRNFMDALFAFWPGLQVLKGDIKPAIEIHEMLYQVIQRHNFLPEAFTTDFRVHWAQHPLRPEFIESTYFLYRATKDPHYLDVGKKVMENLKKYAKVPCGFAALKHVTTNQKEDQMDSFVLSETFKYLYLLFSEDEELFLNVDDFVFTTEAHLLPLSLSLNMPSDRNITTNGKAIFYNNIQEEDDFDIENMCPNIAHHTDLNYCQRVRLPLRNMVEKVCPKPNSKEGSSYSNRRRLQATEFVAGNVNQLTQLKNMGIKIVTMSDGRVQLYHTASDALTQEDAHDGMLFMQEMIELSKTQSQDQQSDPHVVQLISEPYYGNVVYHAGPAQFGYKLTENPGIIGNLVIADPFVACGNIKNPELLAGNIAVVKRGECMFIDKARILEEVGAKGAIVIDNADMTSSETSPMFAMSGDNMDDVTIPMLFLFSREGKKLLEVFERHNDVLVFIGHQPKTLEEVLKGILFKENIIGNPGQVRHIDVSIQSIRDVTEEKQEDESEAEEFEGLIVRTFETAGGEHLFRVMLRSRDHKLEMQIDKDTLESATRHKLSKLIAKVASMVQDDINFGQMSIIEQSDSLFSLGKLMEAAVNEDSEEILETTIQQILKDELHLDYAEVKAAVAQEDKVKGQPSSGTTKLLELVELVIEQYIEEQFNTVYSEARKFMKSIGLDIQDEIPEETASNCDEIESETMEILDESETETDTNPYASTEELTMVQKEWRRDNLFRIFKKNNAQFRNSKRIYKAKSWMKLFDDEVFIDKYGTPYANEEYLHFESSIDPEYVDVIVTNCDGDQFHSSVDDLKHFASEDEIYLEKVQQNIDDIDTTDTLSELQNILDDLSDGCNENEPETGTDFPPETIEIQWVPNPNKPVSISDEDSSYLQDETEILTEEQITENDNKQILTESLEVERLYNDYYTKSEIKDTEMHLNQQLFSQQEVTGADNKRKEIPENNEKDEL